MGNGLQTFDNAYLPPKTRYITASLSSHRLSLEDVTKFRKHFTETKGWNLITRGLETIITCPWSRSRTCWSVVLKELRGYLAGPAPSPDRPVIYSCAMAIALQ
uniref:Uncharacterized protein n=1 Tax=Magallana gigas TaxID=29159 RepID=K1S032_MAGGI